MFCKQCDTVLNEGAKFCRKCGSPQVVSPQSVAIVACGQPSLTRWSQGRQSPHTTHTGVE